MGNWVELCIEKVEKQGPMVADAVATTGQHMGKEEWAWS